MQLVTIVTEKQIDELKEIVNKHVKSFSYEGIIIDEKFDKHNNSINYIVDENTIRKYALIDFINLFKYEIGNAIYEYIKTVEEPNMIRDFINLEYNYFNIDERKEILQRSLNLRQTDMSNKEELLSQKTIIVEELIQYLETNNIINLKGFMTFRLRAYIDEIKMGIDEAVEDFLMDKEYNEFIKLLRYFVDIQDPKLETVHIFLKDENRYDLFDNSGKEINNEYLRLIAKEMKENEISYDDLLISSLITIAPQNIIIHKTGNNNFEYILKTINRIFNNRVELCDGCQWCIIKSNAKKE